MKRTTQLFFLLQVLVLPMVAQDCPNPVQETALPISNNKFTTSMSTDGTIFLNGLQTENDLGESTNLAFSGGLWVGGILGDNEDLAIAVQRYGANQERRDFYPGPIDANSNSVNEADCLQFDKTWLVTREDIEAHLIDYYDNGQIDTPNEAVFSWPAHQDQDSYFYQYNGFNLPAANTDFASFFDKNNNGIYEPNLGEYPQPPTGEEQLLPEILTWNVINDLAGPHTTSLGNPLSIEVQQTLWTYECEGFEVLENTLFHEHKIFNRGTVAIDSMSTGIWIDYDIGCDIDDYVGSMPEQDSYFAYNIDALDGYFGVCENNGVSVFGTNIPMQSMTFLNRDLDKTIAFISSGIADPAPAMLAPGHPQEYYNYLNGRWRDDSPLYYAYAGFLWQPDSTIEITDHIFPSDPRDEEGWSMYSMNNPWDGITQTIGSTYESRLLPNEFISLQTAHCFHQDSSLYYLDVYDLMKENITTIQRLYDADFKEVTCSSTIATEDLTAGTTIEVYPNPSKGTLYFSIPETININRVELFNTKGVEVHQWNPSSDLTSEIRLPDLPSSIYFLKIHTNKGIVNKKIMVLE